MQVLLPSRWDQSHSWTSQETVVVHFTQQKLLRGPYLWLKDRHGCLLSLRLRVHIHGVRSSILCNPLRKQHTQRHGAKLMGYHNTSFRHKQNATHRNLANKKKKNPPELKQEQGKKRGNRCNDQHYLQGSVLFQRNKILRHAGSFNTLVVSSRFSAVTPRHTSMRL